MIATKRLLLRGAKPSDAADLFEVYGDPETMRYWSHGPDTHLSQSETRVGQLMAQPGPPQYLVFEKAGKAIGAGGVYDGEAEIGYILHRAYWRQGLMREALQALIPYLFDNFDLPKLVADVEPNNVASIRLLCSLGFVETSRASKTIEIDGVWYDSIYLTLYRPS